MWERRGGNEGGWNERIDNKNRTPRFSRLSIYFCFFARVICEFEQQSHTFCSHSHAVFSTVREEDLGRVLVHNVCQGIGVHAVKIRHNMKHLSVDSRKKKQRN